MLIQGLTPDPECKLIISSVFTVTHLLDCLIFTRNVMCIALLLSMVGGGGGGGEDELGGEWLVYILRCGWGDRP